MYIPFYGIEGIPVIIRFKTSNSNSLSLFTSSGIEGIPVIIRFKTIFRFFNLLPGQAVLKVFQL